jgi:2-methylisocitrate lyase-like PEP mutase family enzyme
MTVSTADKRAAFRALHQAGCFVIPNPWDVGSAIALERLGFKALASTSSGMAWSMGMADNHVDRDLVLGHLTKLAAAVDVPLNADFEGGFAVEPKGVAESVALCVETGVAGLSIEDSTGDADEPLFEFPLAVERIDAARAAIDARGADVLLTARSEGFIVGRPDMAETLRRLNAFSEAGADCLYAPGIRTREEIAAVVAAVAPKPFNLLVASASPLTMAEIAALGVRRVSVGGAFARAAWGGFMRAATLLAHDGSFAGLADAASGQALNTLFGPTPTP